MGALPDICLVDTNVIIAANGPDLLNEEQYCCIEPCIKILEHIQKGECKVVLDDNFYIIKEYQYKTESKRQRGPGDIFLKWIFTNMYNSRKIECVTITPNGDSSYKEFPIHPGLKEFDPSDRKFVAAANAHAKKPPILEATDCKWVGWEAALKEEGLTVLFVCEKYVREKYVKKMGKN